MWPVGRLNLNLLKKMSFLYLFCWNMNWDDFVHIFSEVQLPPGDVAWLPSFWACHIFPWNPLGSCMEISGRLEPRSSVSFRKPWNVVPKFPVVAVVLSVRCWGVELLKDPIFELLRMTKNYCFLHNWKPNILNKHSMGYHGIGIFAQHELYPNQNFNTRYRIPIYHKVKMIEAFNVIICSY